MQTAPKLTLDAIVSCYALLLIDYIEFLQCSLVKATLTQNDKLAYFQQALLPIRSQTS